MLRIAWTAAAFGFLIWLVATNPAIWAAFRQLAVAPATPAALGLLLLAKILYAWGVSACLAAGGARQGYRAAFYAYSLSQIGKYIPGGVWQFLGRHQIYRDWGIGHGHSLRLIGMETGFLVGSAALLGAVVALLPGVIDQMEPAQATRLQLAGLAGLAIAVGAIALAWMAKRPKLTFALTAIGIFCLAWMAAGASVSMLLPQASLLISGPAYALGFAAGMLAVFAPAGIGVRETAFVFLVVPLAPTEAAAAAILLHRALYLLGDLTMALAALAISHHPPPHAG